MKKLIENFEDSLYRVSMWKNIWFWILLITSPIWLALPLLILAYYGGL